MATRDLLRRKRPKTHCGCARLQPDAAVYVQAPGARVATPQPPSPPVSPQRPTTPTPLSPITSPQEVLNRFHDQHSPIGRVRRMEPPKDEPRHSWQFDPFNRKRGD